jgi:hypothetical protein
MATLRRHIPASASNVAWSPGSADLFDVLDRVLAKGIVIDAWVRLELSAIDLVTVKKRVAVYLEPGVRFPTSLVVPPGVRRPQW